MADMDEISRLEQQIDAVKQDLAAKAERLARKKKERRTIEQKQQRKREHRRKYIVGGVVLRYVMDATEGADLAFRAEVIRRIDTAVIQRDRQVLAEVLPELRTEPPSTNKSGVKTTDPGTDDPAPSTDKQTQTDGAAA